MKKFILKEILLMSAVEQKARRISFQPTTNIVIGENDTGKSSLIKSIYWTFGTELPDVHEDWTKLKVASLVKFMVDNKNYSIIRREGFFALFDENSKLIGSYDSVTTQLGPVLSEIFDFKLLLTDRKGQELIPPPAYYLLPFYIDQDSGWHKNWSSFEKLNQIPTWRKSVVEYHTGIKTNEHYIIQSKINQIKTKITDLRSEKNFFSGTLEEVKKEVDSLDANLDVVTFEKEIDEMMTDLKWLQKSRAEFKASLVEKYNSRNNITVQIDIVSKALNENRADYKFATSHEEIDCPTCGQIYENGFSDRFSIAQDENKCHELLTDLHLELLKTNEEIKTTKTTYEKYESEISKLEVTLAKKRGQLTLKDVIESEGKKQMKDFLFQKNDFLRNEISLKDDEVIKLNKELKELIKRDKDKKVSIMSLYMNKMRAFLQELDVQQLSETVYSKIDFDVKESGSDKPRALLAYYYSILSVMREYSSSVFAPIIIDSPNQQDQDTESLKKMLTFIRDKKIDDSQLILGLTNLQGIDYDGNFIRLENKRSLLLETEYKDVSAEINRYISLSLLRVNK